MWSFASLGLKSGEKSKSAKRLQMCLLINAPTWGVYRETFSTKRSQNKKLEANGKQVKQEWSRAEV